MSDRINHDYSQFLYDENTAEEVAGLQNTALLSQVSSAIASIAMFTSSSLNFGKRKSQYNGRVPGSKNKKRKRRDMDSYLSEMDDKLFRRKYRMVKQSFFDLLDIIKDGLLMEADTKDHIGAPPDGVISPEADLSSTEE